jgi:hypothetical protein
MGSAILCALAALLLCAGAQAQKTASVSGTVHDSSEALLPGAKVTLINEASKATRSATSNNEGYFNFMAVQPATYSIQVTRSGFETSKITGIEVHPGDSLTVPKIKLVLGNVVESVVVTADVAGVQLTSPEHSTLITSGDIARLSTTGRDALELVAMLPGFASNSGLSNTGADYTTTTFGSGNAGAYGVNGAAPQQGFVNITSDGASVIDPGDMGATTQNINMDQVQEVKVQTSNFGADEAKGPIVIGAVGKSGGSTYHGSLYTYARNYSLNSNDWVSNYNSVQKSALTYLYPGGNIGGPVKIPFTKFNQNKHLTFWAGMEDYRQNANANGASGGPVFAFIPTPSMLGKDPSNGNNYDLSNFNIATAFNVDHTELAANCTEPWTQTAAYANIGGDCFTPAGQTDQNGIVVPSTGSKNGYLNSVNPAMATFTNMYPAINITPGPINGYASSGFNYAKNVIASNNGLQLHTRVDQNFSENLKLYVTYNLEQVNSEAPLNNIFYNPPGTLPYPTPLFSHGYSHVAALNLTKIVSATITNELVGAGVFFNQPEQLADPSKATITGTPWAAAGYTGGALKTATTQMPRIYSWEGIGIPNYSIGYIPQTKRGEFYRKSSWNVADNFTKVFATHTIKAGVYVEQTRNNQNTPGSDVNSTILFDRYNGCMPNQTSPTMTFTASGSSTTQGTWALKTPGGSSLGNTVANFLAGCPGGYSQSTSDPSADMYFNSLEFYGTDEWKVLPKLTLTLGIRLSHLPPWQDSHGVGAAVWNPTKYNPVSVGVPLTTMTTDTRTWPGISWHALDKTIPNGGMGSRLLFYAPRVGLAYDFYGDGKTTLRGGWGAYRSRDSYNLVAGALNTAIDQIDYSVTATNTSCTLDQLMNGAGYTPGNTSTPNAPLSGNQVLYCGYYQNAPNFPTAPQFGNASSVPIGTASVNAANPNDSEQPVTYNYNLSLDQMLPKGLNMEIAYVGNQSASIATSGNLANQNIIPLGKLFGPDPLTGQINTASGMSTTLQADYRPYPNYTSITVPNHVGWANYNGLQISLNKQRGSLAFGSNYTWSKAMGLHGLYNTGSAPDPVNLHHDYGIVQFDRPQVLNFTYSYQEGKKFHGNRELGWILNTWELSGITSFQSGPNLAINSSSNFGFGAQAGYISGTAPNLKVIGIPVGASAFLGTPDYTLQPDVICDPRRNLPHSAILSGNLVSKFYANGSCFKMPAIGTQGWWNLPDVHGPAYEKSDLTVNKDIQINDRQNLQFRVAAFNFLNHPLQSFGGGPLGSALSLTFTDPTCSLTTGAGCLSSQQAAISGLQLSNAGFGATPYKQGVRIVELGMKYNF